jgi:hypothetical protein
MRRPSAQDYSLPHSNTAVVANLAANVSDGSEAEVGPLERHVRSTHESRHQAEGSACPLRARRRHSGTSSNVRVSRWSRDRSSRLTFQLSSNDRHQSTRWAWHVWRCRLICRTNVLPRRRPAARPSRSDQDAARAPPTGGVGQQSPETGRRARSAFEGARSRGPAGE